jgi:RHS repeat-associated protein
MTVTDQAGKKRKNVTDALGRLIEVYEDPNGLNYQTSYTYDVIDNLIKVTQGTQQRFFMYDSLKRLIRARNPEQSTLAGLALSDPLTGNSAWSLGYQYDANSNLTQKTDARGVVSTYAYDALNRNTTIDYSDTASINPDVKWFYDGATNGKGRLWYFYKGGDFSTGSNVEHKAIDSYDALGKPLVQRQLFKLNGTWSPTYQISRGYNLGGGATSQTYPSGRAVSYTYDTAGRTASFTGNLGDGVTRTYASTFVYNARNQITQELFGTQTPLYHKLQYNIRGQLWDVRVSTGADVNGSWNRGALQFFYESTLTHGASGPDNNGNVLKSSHYVPLDEAASTWSIPHQLYTYDALNRLSSVAEYALSSTQPLTQTAQQSYSYNDRWGNRTINLATSWGTGVNTKQFTVDPATNRLGVPGDQPGTMSYDNAGNLTTDTYTGAGARTYDADNRMLTATDNTGQTSRYTYDAEGHRVRRQIASSQEEWQIYGLDGELVAEYRAAAAASAPEKEYGYRDGQLLITATGRYNVALAANGATATASSTATGSGFSPTGAINGNNRGPWGNGEGWNDNTPNSVPDWLQVDFAGSKTIDEISVFGLHDNYTIENTPTETQTFTLYGLLAFDVQYWNGSSWTTVPGGSVTGNNKVWRKFTFSPITTSKIRVTVNQVPDSWSRVVEIQAFGTSASGEKVQWLVPDHLGTPRIILDQTGSLANVKRHDYLPFGEEMFAGTAGRTVGQGYAADSVRQQFTSKERDIETGLDYFGARYYSSIQGRFTSVDPDNDQAWQDLSNPQSWNAYSYVNNNPLRYIDPDGNALDDPSLWQQLKEIWHNGTTYGYWMTNAELHAAATAARTQVAVEFGIVDSEGNYRPIDLSRISDGEALRIRDDLVTLREAGQIQNMGDRIPEGPAMQPPVGLGGTQKPNGNTNTPNTRNPKANPNLEIDATGKVHGKLPRSVPKQWTREQLEDSASALRQSIANRKAELRRLGEHGPHRARIGQEERLLRQIEKKLSGS